MNNLEHLKSIVDTTDLRGLGPQDLFYEAMRLVDQCVRTFSYDVPISVRDASKHLDFLREFKHLREMTVFWVADDGREPVGDVRQRVLDQAIRAEALYPDLKVLCQSIRVILKHDQDLEARVKALQQFKGETLRPLVCD